MDLLALLFPREKKFYKMVEEQVELVGEAVEDFHTLITQFNKLTPQKRRKLIAAISKREKEDDILYTKMVQSLKSTFITPMDREDLHQLVATFDSIIDTLELLSLKLTAFNINKIDQHFKEQTEIFSEAFRLIQKTILSIRSEAQVEKYCLEIRSLEQKADRIFIHALKDLFSDSVNPVIIIKHNDLYASLEDMVDRLNEASLIIENLAVKYS